MDSALPFVLPGLLIVVLAFLYNTLISRRNRAEYAFASVDALLMKRHDLVPNLVAAVRGYMDHERDLLESVTALRSKAAAQPLGAGARMQTEALFVAALGTLLARVEAYPELKASENMLHFQATLNELEEQISAARRFFNAAVANYNTAVESFPTNLIANMAGMKRREFFEIPSVQRAAPSVSGLARP